MNQRTLLLPFATAIALAACGKTDSGEAAVDSVLAVVPPAPPSTPHVVGFDLGRQVEAGGGIVGGSTDLFTVGDTIVVAIRTQHTRAGDEVAVRMRKGDKTVDSLSAPLPATDSTGMAAITLHFGPAKPWATGSYRIETFLGGNSQGIKEITIK
ncbi:MAG: hypothetical protein ABJC19_08115 [Gemmatimonadota bacterium]